MVECVAPEPGKTIADPACGTGGFFLAAYDYLVKTHKLDKEQKAFLKNRAFHGNKFSYDELVARDKTSLDLFWLKDDNQADLDNLPEPEILAEEIIENIEAGLLSFRAVAAALQPVGAAN